jgi:serine phosphatase RsbU (regulator of sigma subunit)/anti-sigma regulatory factor (Ser/Thr protein kinase)
LPALISLAVKGKKVILLPRARLEQILAGRRPPEGFAPAQHEALGILPLERKGSLLGVCIFLCSASFSDEPESQDVLAVFAGIAADNLATAREFERSLASAKIAESDAKRAKFLQEQLTPKFRRSGEIVFWASLQAAGELAGDVTIVHVLSEGHLNAWTADVAGRGSPAAWSMMFIRQLLAEMPVESSGPGEALRHINSKLHEIETEHDTSGLFITCMGINIDSSSRKALFARAGAPILYRINSDGIPAALDPEGIPLGIFPDARLEEIEIPFGPGEKLVWASDGFYTARNDPGECFGVERMLDCLLDAGFLPARALYEKILASLGDFGVEDKAVDDRSLLVIGYCGKPDWSAKSTGGQRDRLLDEALEFVSGYRVSDRDFRAVRILLDEAIKNANEHGNKGNPQGRIEVRITCDPRFVHLAVRDEGGRLNERVTSPMLRTETILEDKGRGFLLMRHQADHLWVEDDRGELNAVRLLEDLR